MPATPTGTIQLQLDGQPIAGASAQLAADGLPAGASNITAAYSGDANFLSSVSPVVVQQVGQAQQASVTALTSDPNPSTEGQQVAFSGSVTAQA